MERGLNTWREKMRLRRKKKKASETGMSTAQSPALMIPAVSSESVELFSMPKRNRQGYEQVDLLSDEDEGQIIRPNPSHIGSGQGTSGQESGGGFESERSKGKK